MSRIVSFIAVLLTASAAPAGADVFAELDASVTFPEGDEAYDDLIDTSTSYGVRGGWLFVSQPLESAPVLSWVAGVELGASTSTLSHDGEDPDNPSFRRRRALAGIRGGVQLPDWLINVRVGVGVEEIHMRADGFLGALCGSPKVKGLATEAAVVSYLRLGRFLIGGQLGVARGVHEGDRPECTGFERPVVVDVLDFNSVDVTFSLVAGARL